MQIFCLLFVNIYLHCKYISITACIYSHYANPLPRCSINVLLKFIILYFNNFILLRPENLYIILARHNELPEDNILKVETCSSMLFVIIVFNMIVQLLVKIVNKKNKKSVILNLPSACVGNKCHKILHAKYCNWAVISDT